MAPYPSMTASQEAMAVSMVEVSSRESPIVHARALSFACAGLRAPHKANVTPGWASVQAMTTCAIVAPRASAIGRIASANRATFWRLATEKRGLSLR